MNFFTTLMSAAPVNTQHVTRNTSYEQQESRMAYGTADKALLAFL